MYKVAPLPATFMFTSIVGFLITALYVMRWDITWGISFLILFAVMFIASFISMTKAPLPEESAPRKPRKK
jgi:hypothetical protein